MKIDAIQSRDMLRFGHDNLYTKGNIMTGHQDDNNPDNWVTTSEASEMMNLRRDTVAEYCRRGMLKANKFGRDWMVWKADVIAYSKTNTGRPRKD